MNKEVEVLRKHLTELKLSVAKAEIAVLQKEYNKAAENLEDAYHKLNLTYKRVFTLEQEVQENDR